MIPCHIWWFQLVLNPHDQQDSCTYVDLFIRFPSFFLITNELWPSKSINILILRWIYTYTVVWNFSAVVTALLLELLCLSFQKLTLNDLISQIKFQTNCTFSTISTLNKATGHESDKPKLTICLSIKILSPLGRPLNPNGTLKTHTHCVL